MREAVYLAMAGIVPSIDAAFEMDEIMRSAAIIVANEIEQERRLEMTRAFAVAMRIQ
jgi:hypothetical protein